jgi:hypothetical protein
MRLLVAIVSAVGGLVGAGMAAASLLRMRTIGTGRPARQLRYRQSAILTMLLMGPVMGYVLVRGWSDAAVVVLSGGSLLAVALRLLGGRDPNDEDES